MVVLICGASGILGKNLCNLLQMHKIVYIGTYNKNVIENSIQLDFLNVSLLQEKMKDYNITTCVNCIVERQVDICENNWSEIKQTNIDITNNLSKSCKVLNIHLIHISSDYIFDGRNPPYFPTSQPNPLQNYGISKLISEYKVLSSAHIHTIIRVPVLYTDNIQNLEETAVTLIGKKILNQIIETKEDNYSVRRPVYIPDLCYFILDCILDSSKKMGIYHFYNPYDKTSKFEIAKIISEFLNKKMHIEPINEEPCDGVERPNDTFLQDDKYDITTYKFTPIKEGIEKCFQKLWHPKLHNDSNMNVDDIFFMIDLDGTLINSDKIHYESYNKVLIKNNINLDYTEYYEILENEGIDVYLEKKFNVDKKKQIKNEKNEIIKQTDKIELITNADKFINYINKYSINHVVVTNTSLENVDFFKKKIPILNKLTNWVTREDYCNPKPDPECYKLGKNKYYKNEKYIIGFENSMNGYISLKNVTECIYILTEKCHPSYNILQHKDAYLINDFNSIFS